MQAYKLRGKIDATGNLVVVEPLNMPPGDVEIIVLRLANTVVSSPQPLIESEKAKPKRKMTTKIKALQAWFENTDGRRTLPLRYKLTVISQFICNNSLPFNTYYTFYEI